MFSAVSLPNFADHWHPQTLARLAHEAEEAGWDGFFIWNHILFHPSAGIAISDPWVVAQLIALGWLATTVEGVPSAINCATTKQDSTLPAVKGKTH